MHAKDVGFGQQLVETDITRVECLLLFRRQASAVVVDHRHVEAMGASGHLLPDATHAQDAERGVMYVGAEELFELPTGPLAIAQIALRLADAACCGEDQGPGEVGGGIVKHARGIGRHHAMLGTGGEVEIIEADGDVAYRFQIGAARQQRGVDAIDEGGQRPCLAGQSRRQLLGTERHIVLIGVDLEVLGQIGEHFVEHLARDQDLRSHRLLVQHGRQPQADLWPHIE